MAEIDLNAEFMQNIAREINLSESAFLMRLRIRNWCFIAEVGNEDLKRRRNYCPRQGKYDIVVRYFNP